MNDGATVWQGDQARRAVRAALEAAGLTLKQASRALGRNDAYLQQYLYRGSPRQLPESLRLRLAAIAGVGADAFLDDDLRALRDDTPAAAIAVPMFDVSATAGGGRMEHDAGANGALAFPAPLLRRITAAPADGLRLITISGDCLLYTSDAADEV